MLRNGVYRPRLDVHHGLVLSADVTLRAQYPGQAVIDGGGDRTVVRIVRGTIRIEGVVIMGGGLKLLSLTPEIVFATGSVGGGLIVDEDASAILTE